ncbi:MAG TPA: hypothetical protein VKG38_16690, partial [Solirubrobacteraceae bacterium]|nr:hypothetical protein [Solirubrobacteraceae bacterium]
MHAAQFDPPRHRRPFPGAVAAELKRFESREQVPAVFDRVVKAASPELFQRFTVFAGPLYLRV